MTLPKEPARIKPFEIKVDKKLGKVPQNCLTSGTEAESRPLFNTEHMFERIGAKCAKYFTIIDFTQGFRQVKVYPLFRLFTAFITFLGILLFKRVPFSP